MENLSSSKELKTMRLLESSSSKDVARKLKIIEKKLQLKETTWIAKLVLMNCGTVVPKVQSSYASDSMIKKHYLL